MKLVRLSVLGLAMVATIGTTAFADGSKNPRRPTVKNPKPAAVAPPQQVVVKTEKVDLTPVMERLTAIENQLKEQDAKLDKIQSDLAACCAYQKEMLDKMWYHVERTCYAVAEIEKETSLIDTINGKLNKIIGVLPAQTVMTKPVVTTTPTTQTVTKVVRTRAADTASKKWSASFGAFTPSDLPAGVKADSGTSVQLTRTLSESKRSRLLVGVNKADYTVTSGIAGLTRAAKLDETVPYVAYQLKLGAHSNQPQGLYIGALAGTSIRSFLEGANVANTNQTVFKTKTTSTPTFGGMVGYDITPRLYIQADFLTNSKETQRLNRGIGFGLGSRF
jgi:hypothetical protein